MGPLILLSLLGVGAATAFIDVSSSDTVSDETADENESPEAESAATETSEGSDSDTTTASFRESITARIFGSPSLPASETEIGTDGDDVLHARGTENIDAGAGNDTLTAFGDGLVFGDEGDDVFELGGVVSADGGEGEDYMRITDAASGFGGFGDDTFVMINAQSADEGPARADGGDGDDTFMMRPFAGLPEETVAHVLTGGAGSDVYALDIASAEGISDDDEADERVVAVITDFDPEEDMLLLDIGAAPMFDEVDTLTAPEVSTSPDPDGTYVDVHFTWTNPLNDENTQTRIVRLEGVSEFDVGDVQLTSIMDPDSHYNEEPTGEAAAHRLYALTAVEGTFDADTLVFNESAATTLQDGDDHVTIEGGSHLTYGGDGNDVIEVVKEGTGATQLFGGEGDDVLTADMILNSDTVLIGGGGDDTITFGMGHYVDAGEGSDTLIFNIRPDAMEQGPAVLRELSGTHLTINVPPEVVGDVHVVNHVYGNGFEVAYSEIMIGDEVVLKVLEEDFVNGVGIAEVDPRVTIMRDVAA